MVIEKPNYVTSVTNGKFTTANPTPRQILQKQMFWVDNSASTRYFHVMLRGIEPFCSWTAIWSVKKFVLCMKTVTDFSQHTHVIHSVGATTADKDKQTPKNLI